MNPRNSLKHIFGCNSQFAQLLQFMSEYVEQHFRVGIGIQVALVLDEEFLLELFGIGQITVVRKRNALGGIDIERLGFSGTGAAGGRITNMGNAHGASKVEHVTGMEDISHQTAAFAQVKLLPLAGDDARCILTTVLKHRQGFIKLLIHFLIGDDTGNATHNGFLASLGNGF